MDMECIEVHRRFLTALDRGDTATAYQLMVSSYREGHTVEEFADDVVDSFRSIMDGDAAWACVGYYEGERDIGLTDGMWAVGVIYRYRYEEGAWRFTGHTESCFD